jgi:hypothetical protein
MRKFIPPLDILRITSLLLQTDTETMLAFIDRSLSAT